jgi:hypothetical protein
MGYNVGEVAPLLTHRGITHSLLLLPVTALLLSWLWWRRAVGTWRQAAAQSPPPPGPDSTAHPDVGAAQAAAAPRQAEQRKRSRPRFLPRLACLLLAGLSHPLVDACTSFGTDLLSPVWREHFALHALPRLDPAFTLLVVLTLGACWIVRRRASGGEGTGLQPQLSAVGGPILPSHLDSAAPAGRMGETPTPRGGAPRATIAIAAAGLLLAGSYVAAGRMFHNRVADLARQAAAPEGRQAGAAPASILSADAYPVVGSIFLWRAVVHADGRWLVARVRPWYDVKTVRDSWKLAADAEPNDPWISRAKDQPFVQTYFEFATGRVRAVSTRDPNGEHIVLFHDMRYGRTVDDANSRWPTLVTFDKARNPMTPVNMEQSRPVLQTLRETWAEFWRP